MRFPGAHVEGILQRIRRGVRPRRVEVFVSGSRIVTLARDEQRIERPIANEGGGLSLPALLDAAREQFSALRGQSIQTLLLSDSLVHAAVVPWPATFVNGHEWTALARAALVDRHGSQAAQWSVRMGFPSRGAAGLAVGIDPALIGGLQAVARQQRLKIRSIQAHFLDAMDRHQAWQVQQNELLAVSDQDTLALALRSHAGWKSIRFVRYGARDANWVRSLLEREAATCGLSPVALTAIGLAEDAVPQALRPTARLSPGWNQDAGKRHAE